MRRTFNKREKTALYIVGNGNCSICGKKLEAEWHADHVHPYSSGGATDVGNGQALCKDCNLRKGSKVMGINLRDWQKSALRKFEELQKQNFLVVATPGAGKTQFSLALTQNLVERRTIQRVVVVCPTERLKYQWAKEAARIGLQLDPEWTNDKPGLADDYDGVIVTYQQVSMGVGADKLRMICNRVHTHIILDEVHHAGETKAWGDRLYYAFENAVTRLMLSGTPFRSDNNPIAFVEYDNGISTADFKYTYAEALHDGVCRPVFFPTFEGEMQWLSHDGNIENASFADQVSDRKARERLKTALSPRGDWLPAVLEEAHRRLIEVRQNGHVKAAGLVIAMDKDHANAIGDLLYKITGESPVVVHYDNPQASEDIERFASNSKSWIVAVKMVSEGVDIPRLRVVVYATNITSELFFRQAVGRVVRMLPDVEEQNAYFYIPHHDELVEHVKKIKEERDHELEPEWTKEDFQSEPSKERTPQEAMYMLIGAEAHRHNTYFDNETITPNELQEAEVFGKNMGVVSAGTPVELIARILKRARHEFQPKPLTEESIDEPLHKKKERVKNMINANVNRLHFKTGIPFNEIHNEWLRMGGLSHNVADLDHLEAKLKWIIGKIKDYKNAAG